MKNEFKIGDLVLFTAPSVFETAKSRYKNPGIVIEITERTNQKTAYKVIWADGNSTTEWEGYIKPAKKGEEK